MLSFSSFSSVVHSVDPQAHFPGLGLALQTARTASILQPQCTFAFHLKFSPKILLSTHNDLS